MTTPRLSTALLPRQSGFTLVELLVAMTLALLVIAGIGQIYTAAKRSYDVQISLGRMQEVGRYAVDLISQDIRRAGYWGLTNMRAITPNNSVTPNGSCINAIGNTTWGRMVQRRIFGLDNTLTGYACITDQAVNGGDVLTVRYAAPIPVPTGGPPGGWGNSLYIRSAPFEAMVAVGNPPGLTTTSTFSDHLIRTHSYYVRSDPSPFDPCNGGGTGYVPELARKFLNNNSRPETQGLVHGVERLEFQYGLDTDGDLDGASNQRRSVNQYVDAGGVPNWNNVVSVRFWVLVRDECPDPSYTNNNTYTMGNAVFRPTDNYRRQLYTSTVALRN